MSLNLKDVPSPGARWIQVSGTLFLPLCQGLESLDFGMVELKESGVSIPVPDPIAVRRALENNRVEVADMSKLETVTLKVTRQTGRSRHAPANEYRGKSFLFRKSPRFVEVAALYQGASRIRPVPVNIKIGIGGVVPEVLPAPAEVPQADSGSR